MVFNGGQPCVGVAVRLTLGFSSGVMVMLLLCGLLQLSLTVSVALMAVVVMLKVLLEVLLLSFHKN